MYELTFERAKKYGVSAKWDPLKMKSVHVT